MGFYWKTKNCQLGWHFLHAVSHQVRYKATGVLEPDVSAFILQDRGKPGNFLLPCLQKSVSGNQPHTEHVPSCCANPLAWCTPFPHTCTAQLWRSLQGTLKSVPQIIYLFHAKNSLMHTCIIHISLLALCYYNMFRPSRGHLQAVRLIHFHSQFSKVCTKCKIQFIIM